MSKKVNVICYNCLKSENVFPSRSLGYKYCSKECMAIYFTKSKFKNGDFINKWKIISNVPIRKNGRSYVKVKCTCGSCIEKEIPIHHVESKKHKGCEKCSRFHTSKGFGLISGEYWALIKNGALKREIKFNLSIEEAWDLYEKQQGRCKLTDLLIPFEPNQVHKKNNDNRIKRLASLDRIDSKKSYVINNVQWVHKDINKMKNNFNQEYFIKLSKLICKNN